MHRDSGSSQNTNYTYVMVTASDQLVCAYGSRDSFTSNLICVQTWIQWIML